MTQSQKNLLFILFLALLFLFRLGYGLCSDIVFEDQRQVYILGLKYFCTGQWPYFGPDVTLGIQIPGALQALAVGLPLKIWPIPEAPYLFLGLLSFASLCFLAWYFSKHLPKFPSWILWTWVLTCPWALNASTNILNVSYVLFGGVFFFIGFMETIPTLSLGLIAPWLCNAMIGFALLWNAQFHLSTVILVPYIALSLYFQLKSKGFSSAATGLFFLLIGAALSGAFLLPTYLQYGLQTGAGGTQKALAFNQSNFLAFFTILARYFSLASCEVPRFIGSHTDERLRFLGQYLWAAPFIIVAGILGVAQPIVMLVSGLRKEHPQKDWKAVKVLAWGTFALIYVSFLFAIKAPAAHTYFVTLPVVLLYAFYVLSPWVSKNWFTWVAGVLLVCNLVFALSVAMDNFQHRSLYQERATFTKAIQEKNYTLVGERRPSTLY